MGVLCVDHASSLFAIQFISRFLVFENLKCSAPRSFAKKVCACETFLTVITNDDIV